jgi:eukaryotic-like serine/threonine-protein kinase
MASVPHSASDAHWDRLQDLFARALELPTDQRESFIAAECADDPALRDEVMGLIACDVGSSTGPLTNALGAAIDATTRDRRGALIGKLIGSYRVVGVLGHGGTGTVYLGERADQQYSAKVAIKIVDSAAVHPDLGMRFRAERQILANLNHVNIARLVDAGETEDGRPYLVMEYVEGQTAEVYCDFNRLPIAERLQLFLQVCAAVQYAHQNLVVHRDLKPANVLVTGEGVPKLLDFGIAKLLDAGNAAAALALTRMNDRLLTPEYAAPEQILGQPVTTASDVYALGTVLYELLTGIRPFVVPSSTTQLELERLICISDPQRPSAAIRRAMQAPGVEGQKSVADIASARDLSPERLARRLMGDLDAICMRALRKEPQHRYSSVEQLADDVRRYLAREPVAARQGTWLYYSQRFVRRHAFGVSAAAIFVVFVSAFAVIMSLQAQRIAAERDRATQERARAETVSTFMLDVFGAADPFVSQGREITARELLDQAGRRIQGDLSHQPEVRARLLEAIGQAYRRQGQFSRAVSYLSNAVQLRRQSLQSDQTPLAGALIQLAMAQRNDGQFEASEKSFEEASERLARSQEKRTLTQARLLAEMGRLHLVRGDLGQAEKYLTDSVALIRAIEGNRDPELADVLLELTSVHMWKGDLRAAEAAVREAVAINHATLPPLHPDRVLGDFQMAELLSNLGRHDEAGGLVEDVLKARRTLFGASSNEVADTLDALATIRERQGRLTEAQQLSRQALQAQERSMGSEHFLAGYQHASLGTLLLKGKNAAAAEQEARTALQIYGKTLPPDHQYVAAAEHLLGETLLAQRRFAEAETVLTASRSRWQRTNAPPWRAARTESALGEAVFRQQRADQAEQLLLEGYRGVAHDPSASAEARERTRERLTRFYRETGRREPSEDVAGSGS